MFERRPEIAKRLRSPGAMLAVACALAVVSMCLPAAITDRARTTFGTVLRPGQITAARARDACADTLSRLDASWRDSRSASELAATVRRLEAENETLRRQAARLADEHAGGGDATLSGRTTDPLLALRLVEARLLGRFARGVLSRHGLLDAGATDGVAPGSLVVEQAIPMVDQGHDAGIRAGQRVLAGAAVWGKVTQVTANTSYVQPADDPEFRDLVQLATTRGEEAEYTARGILAGIGDGRAELRQVDASAPVAVGDLVLTVEDEGVLDAPLRFGKVTAAHLPEGGSHWQIEVELDAPHRPRQVWVVEAEPNAARLAARPLR